MVEALRGLNHDTWISRLLSSGGEGILEEKMTDARAMQILRGAKLTKQELKDQQERARIAEEVIRRDQEARQQARGRVAALRAQRAQAHQDEIAGVADEMAVKIEHMKRALQEWREEQAILGI